MNDQNRTVRWVLPLLLVVPSLAWGQVDDPGLTQPPPTVAPPRVRPARPVPRAAQPGAAVTDPGVREEVTEEVTTSPTASMTDDEWEKSTVSPMVGGPAGLLRTHTTDVGKPLSFRTALYMQGFSQDCFLISGAAVSGQSCVGGQNGADQNARFLGDLSLSLTGPDVLVLRNMELYLTILNSSNQNKREDRGRTDPSVILALGDVAVGLKGGWEVARGFSLGGHVGVRFFNSIADTAANFDATSASFDLIGTIDVRKYAANVPLRFHLNAGYFLDNSTSLLPAGQCAQSSGVDACIRSRVVETFAYGLGVSRMRFAGAVELPFRPHVSWGIFGVAPFVEYHLEYVVGEGDLTVGDALRAAGSVASDRIDNALAQYLTVGLRLRPVGGLVINAGVDIGLQSPGFQYGPPVPAWNVVVGAAYAYDTSSGGTKVIKRTVTRTIERDPARTMGKVRITVRDGKTSQPISHALVHYLDQPLSTQATDDNGVVVSYMVNPGPVRIDISRDDYLPTQVTTHAVAGSEAPVDVTLLPKPRLGKIHIRARDEKGTKIMGGSVRCTGPESRDANPEGDGWTAAVQAGEYSCTVDAPGYLAKDAQISAAANQETTAEVTLRKRPKSLRVTVGKDALQIKGTIHFGTNNATILPDGLQLLDEVADAIAKNPQIRKISIEGHTDNRGVAAKNLQLSKERADAVRAYLVKQGIASDRLSSDGFGAARPLVPNLTPANRAKNRRVDFKIADGGAQP